MSLIGLLKEIVINRALVIIPIAIIFMYSAIKIRAKVPDLYSVLNPDTSSDSPSARSNGVRLVSARDVIIQVTNNGHSIKERTIDPVFEKMFSLIVDIKIIGVKIIKAILTSYEIV